MKKIMAFALCLTLLLSAFAGGAVAEEDPVVIENMGRKGGQPDKQRCREPGAEHEGVRRGGPKREAEASGVRERREGTLRVRQL